VHRLDSLFGFHSGGATERTGRSRTAAVPSSSVACWAIRALWDWSAILWIRVALTPFVALRP